MPLLQQEQRKAVGIGMWNESFLTQRRKFVAADLGADHALEGAHRLMAGLDSGLVAFVPEGRVDLTAFDLAVLIVGVAGIDLE